MKPIHNDAGSRRRTVRLVYLCGTHAVRLVLIKSKIEAAES